VYSACLLQASAKLDVNHVVKRLMGASRLSFATADETRDLTGMEIGGVTVFGLPVGLPLYADVALKAQPYIIVGSGNRTSKVKMAPGELAKIPNCSYIKGLSIT
jgi:prolyl-tRNA editing enzyme YbaK/EbsC (Cys-tRNA(Pro) deacylase)